MNAYERKLSSGLVASLLVLSALSFVPLIVSPVHAANAQFTNTLYYPYATICPSVCATTDIRTLKISNPLGNLGITEVDLNVPAAAAQTVSAGAFPASSGFVSTGTVAVAGVGPWSIVYPGSSSTTVILPAGAAGKIDFSFMAEAAETTTGTADAYTLTITVHYSDGSTQSNSVTFYEGSLATTSVATTVTTATAGTSFTYTVTLGSKDAGLPLSFFSNPTVANIVADGYSASFGSPTVTTGSSLTYTSTFTSQEASATALADSVTCSDASCFYFATADVAATHGSADANGFITASFPGTHVTINPAAPTQVKVTLLGTGGGWDKAGHSQDFISSVGPATLGVKLADTFGNGITTSAASGTVTLSALQGTLSATTGTVTSGALVTAITYQPLKASCTSNCLLQYGTFDLISASLVIPSTSSLAGTYAGSSNQLSMGFAYTSTFVASAPTIFRYTSFVGDTTGASGSGNAVAGSTVNLAVTLTGGSGPQKGVPVNFTVTSTSTTTAYTGTFSNGKAWIIVNSNSLGVASVNFTADTTSGDAATASYAISAPTSYATYSTTNTIPSASSGAVTTIAAAGTKLKISTYSDTGLTTANSYVKPSGHLYLNIKLQDSYGNSVPWSSAFALQITLATSAGGLSATTVYIQNGQTATYPLYQVQFTAPTTLGDVTLSATTTQPSIAAGSKTVHVVSINPSVSLTPVAKTTLSKNTVNVNATGIPSLAASAGTVVVNFKYSLNGAANLTAGITSTNSTGASFTSFSVTFLNGTNTLKVFATDSNGNAGGATFTFTVSHVVSPTQFTSTGATSTKSGGFTGASATFTNTGAAKTVNVYFVWYNSANQIVSVGAQLNVAFAAGGSATFFNSYNVPGTYTVQVFVQDTSGNAASTSYSVTITV